MSIQTPDRALRRLSILGVQAVHRALRRERCLRPPALAGVHDQAVGDDGVFAVDDDLGVLDGAALVFGDRLDL